MVRIVFMYSWAYSLFLQPLRSQEEEHVAQLKLQREALLAKAREDPTALAAHLEKVHFCYFVILSEAISSGIGDIEMPTEN